MSASKKIPNKAALMSLIFWIVVLLAFLYFLNAFQSILLPFVLSLILAYLFDPLVEKICLKAPKLRRAAAIALVMLSFAIILTLLLMLIIPALIRQLNEFILSWPETIEAGLEKIKELTTRFFGVVPFIDNIDIHNPFEAGALQTWLKENSDAILKFVQRVLTKLFGTGASIVSFLSLIFLTPVVTFYILLDWSKLKESVGQSVPVHYQHHVRNILEEINAVLSGFLRGQLLVCAILATWFSITLSVIGLPYGILIGIIIGFVAFIPYLGTWIGIVLGLGSALTQFDNPLQILAVIVVLIMGQLAEGNYLSPKLVGDRVNLHPVWMIFALFAGGTIAGFTGVIIAVPVAATIGVLVRFLMQRYKESVFYLGFATDIEGMKDAEE